MTAEKVTSPTGQAFERAGRAGPVRPMEPAPAIATESGGRRLVIKEGNLFVCCRPNGDIRPTNGGDGIYRDDTRFLSELELTISGKLPVLLSSSDVPGYAMAVASTNPALGQAEGDVEQQSLSIGRFRFVEEKVYETIRVRNFSTDRAAADLEVSMSADFADTFEVRSISSRTLRGEELVPKKRPKGISFGYLGDDGKFRETLVDLDPKPAAIVTTEGRATVKWPFDLEPGDEVQISLTIEASVEGSRAPSASAGEALASVRSSHAVWADAGTKIVSDNEAFDRVIRSAVRDTRLLSTPIDGREVIVAGIPWYVAPFGRDAAITCYEMLSFSPEPARATLHYLAEHQATEDEAWRDAEPGKILHEVRLGELANAGLIPHTPYYGSVDSTPLFLMLAGAYHRWTADLQTLSDLLPALRAGLGWMDRSGDLDGDGFIEYSRRADAGLLNQGWKDSETAIVGEGGQYAQGPIALVEVQAYAYLAKVRMAEVFRALGHDDEAVSLEGQAAALKDAFNDAFWWPEEGTFALALDGNKKQVRSVTSDPGHALYCGIVDASKAAQVADRLMAPDMFSGWGIRTMAAGAAAYNPMSYHNGTVWPHDNALIAAGLKRYGFHEHTNRVVSAMFDAAGMTPEDRLPELYCGFDRVEELPFVEYPVACSPQAWAAAAPFMLVQSMLGISARAHEGVLTINQPTLPDWIRRLELRDLRVGDSKISLLFQRDRERTSFALMEREGSVRISLEE